MRNTRRYGGYVVHIGIVLLFIGFAGQAFKTDAKGLMKEGDLLRVKNYMLRWRWSDQRRQSKLRFIHARPDHRNEEWRGVYFHASSSAFTKASTTAHQLCNGDPIPRWLSDLYVVLAGI